jgi:hypothetical protein
VGIMVSADADRRRFLSSEMRGGNTQGNGLYLYFPSKKEIYRAVSNQEMDGLRRATLEAIEAAEGLRDKDTGVHPCRSP